MKKIFLPLLALVGMVTGFTLSSCGGGGGGEGEDGKAARKLVGKTYEVNALSAGRMTMSFLNAIPGTNLVDADCTWIVDGQGDDVESPVTIAVTQPVYMDDKLDSCTLIFTGWNMAVGGSTAVFSFFGVPLKDGEGGGTGTDGKPGQSMSSYNVIKVVMTLRGMATSPNGFYADSITIYRASVTEKDEETGADKTVSKEFDVPMQYTVKRTL